MKKISYTLKMAIRIVTSAAKDYQNMLENNNYIFIYKNRSTQQIEYFEVIFLPRNFQHLTGIEYVDTNGIPIINSLQFYQKCTHNQLKESEIRFKKDGTTELKLAALPLIINFLKVSKMTAIYNGTRPKLSIDRITGTTNFCLGFTYDKCGYYVPSSALLEDIRNITKGVPLDKLSFPDNLKALIALPQPVQGNQ